MFPSLPQIVWDPNLGAQNTAVMPFELHSRFALPALPNDHFLSPWMIAKMTDVEDEYFDDLDDEDFDDEFDDDFEEELDDDLAALNPEVTAEDLVEADDDLGGMFDDDEEGSGNPREDGEPAAEPDEDG
jgi:hypothetical protein